MQSDEESHFRTEHIQQLAFESKLIDENYYYFIGANLSDSKSF